MKETKPGNALRNVVNELFTQRQALAGLGAPLDVAFLDAQTFGDAGLAREVLNLFVEQTGRLLPTLPDLSPAEQTATAHLLKGSCQGIGATIAAALLQRYGIADAAGRHALYPELSKAFRDLKAAIEARVGAP